MMVKARGKSLERRVEKVQGTNARIISRTAKKWRMWSNATYAEKI